MGELLNSHLHTENTCWVIIKVGFQSFTFNYTFSTPKGVMVHLQWGFSFSQAKQILNLMKYISIGIETVKDNTLLVS